jgi:hypothetical protein
MQQGAKAPDLYDISPYRLLDLSRAIDLYLYQEGCRSYGSLVIRDDGRADFEKRHEHAATEPIQGPDEYGAFP